MRLSSSLESVVGEGTVEPPPSVGTTAEATILSSLGVGFDTETFDSGVDSSSPGFFEIDAPSKANLSSSSTSTRESLLSNWKSFPLEPVGVGDSISDCASVV